jgi:PhnB protein
MRFLIIRKADERTEAGEMPSNEMLLAMGEYNQRMADAGVLLDGTGLRPSREAVRIRFHNGDPLVTDGPFPETRELIAGFTAIEASSMKEAIDWACQWPPLDANGGVELEVRRLYDMEDFVEGDGVALHRHTGDRLARQPDSHCVYLEFKGQCAQAFHFYADCLGGSIDAMMTWGDAPTDQAVPEEWKDKIIHGQMRIGKWTLMASDAPADRYQAPQGFHLQLGFEDRERAAQTFQRLAQKGNITMPFSETFWAEGFGMLVDRFGVPWMINAGMKEGCE